MSKLGVIQIIDSLNAGGAEVLAVNIANALSKEGANSHLCATRKEGVLKNNLTKETGYLFLDRKKSVDISAIFKFIGYLKKNKITIIHAHSSSSFFAFCVKIFKPNIKIVWHDHYGKELHLRKVIPLSIFTFFFNTIISVNSNLKKWAKDNLYSQKVYFLNNFPHFNNFNKITKLKGEKNKRIVHLAGFREQKDHQNLINAFKIFSDNNNDWTLHLIGKMYDDEYTTEIIGLIKKLKLENNIFMYGACLDIYNILNQSTIGVLSSKSEGLPISLLEYGLAKLPVVVTNVGECDKVILHNKSGIVVEKEHPEKLAEALIELIKSKDKRQLYGSLHYRNVIENYSKEQFIKELLKIYKE